MKKQPASLYNTPSLTERGRALAALTAASQLVQLALQLWLDGVFSDGQIAFLAMAKGRFLHTARGQI